MSLEKLMDESGIYPLKLEGIKEIIISLVLCRLSGWKICYGKICYEVLERNSEISSSQLPIILDYGILFFFGFLSYTFTCKKWAIFIRF